MHARQAITVELKTNSNGNTYWRVAAYAKTIRVPRADSSISLTQEAFQAACVLISELKWPKGPWSIGGLPAEQGWVVVQAEETYDIVK